VTVDSTTTSHSFVYDITAGIPAVIVESDGSGTIYYVRDPSGGLLARVKDSSISYYHYDQLGSTRMITNSSGVVTDKYAYDAYGALLTHERSTGSIDQPYQYVGQLGYYTHHQEPDFGLLQLGVRFYDAEVGRFTQRDPIGYRGGWNVYAYVGGNPVFFVDPSGEMSDYACLLICLLPPFIVAYGECVDLCTTANTLAELHKIWDDLQKRKKKVRRAKCVEDCLKATNQRDCELCCDQFPSEKQEGCRKQCSEKRWNQPAKLNKRRR